jgi:predicted DNA binding CopG/RHH family protein
MRKSLKKIPRFKSEKEEREFWQTHDSTEYVDWSKAERGVIFPNLQLTSRPITLRLPVTTIDRVKIQAHKMDVPYQSLIKQYIYEGISRAK